MVKVEYIYVVFINSLPLLERKGENAEFTHAKHIYPCSAAASPHSITVK